MVLEHVIVLCCTVCRCCSFVFSVIMEEIGPLQARWLAEGVVWIRKLTIPEMPMKIHLFSSKKGVVFFLMDQYLIMQSLFSIIIVHCMTLFRHELSRWKSTIEIKSPNLFIPTQIASYVESLPFAKLAVSRLVSWVNQIVNDWISISYTELDLN